MILPVKRYDVLLGCLLLCITAHAQPNGSKLVSCEQMMKEAERAFKQEQFDAAIQKLRAARICDKSLENRVDSAITAVFQAIKKQRDDAITARRQAQTQAFRVQIAALVKTATELKELEPYTGAKLAKKAFDLHADAGTAKALHDYLSDSNQVFLKILNQRTNRSRVAVNEEAQLIMNAVDMEFNYYVNDSTFYAYDRRDSLPGIIGADISAAGDIIIGHTDEIDSNYHLFLLNPYLKYIKHIGYSRKLIQSVVLAADKNHFLLLYKDSSLAVWDTLGTSIDFPPIQQRIISISISCNGRYVAYIADRIPFLGVIDCTHQQTTLIPITSYANDICFSNLDPRQIVIAQQGTGLSIVDVESREVIKVIATDFIAEACMSFNLSDQVICRTADNALVILDRAGTKKQVLKFLLENDVNYFRLSSQDRMVYIETKLLGNGIWDLTKVAGMPTQTIAAPPASISVQGIIDSGSMLVIKHSATSQRIVITDRLWANQTVLDTLPQNGSYLYKCYYSKEKNLLVEEFLDSIRVLDLQGRTTFVYRLGDIDIVAGGHIKVHFHYDKIAYVTANRLYTLSLSRKDVKYIGEVPFSCQVACYKNKFLAVADNAVYIYGPDGVRQRTLIGANNGRSFEDIYITPDEQYIILPACYNGGSGCDILVFARDNLLVMTYSSPSVSVDKIDCLPNKNSFFTFDERTIMEWPLPHVLMAAIPGPGIKESLQYNIPGTLQAVCHSKNVEDLLIALDFYMDRFMGDVNDADLQAIREITDTLAHAFASWNFERSSVSFSLDRLITMYKETLIKELNTVLQRLQTLYNKYLK